MTLTAARRVADAVLYEGYLLYPYRSTSAKNQVRWQFGVLGPPGAVAAGVGEDPAMQAECLLDVSGEDALIDLHVRFLQVQARSVEEAVDGAADGAAPEFRLVDEISVGAARWVTWHEAAEREIELPDIPVSDLLAGRSFPVAVPGGTDVELLPDGNGGVAGRLVRTRMPLAGRLDLSARPVDGADGLLTLRARVENRTDWQPAATGAARDSGARDSGARDAAACYSFVGTHLLLAARGATWLSLADPPPAAKAAAAAATNIRCWPVLVGDDDGGDVVLVSPIILDDHPVIAAESPGDLYDATEIDEILTLRIMTMTDEEKAAARATDARAGAIIDRSDDMPPEIFERLHGALRSFGTGEERAVSDVPAPAYALDIPTYGEPNMAPWFTPEADASVSPEHDSVRIGDVTVAKGSRVRLRPTRRADAQDLFLADRTAVVARVDSDVDGATHVAVLLEDDPGRDLNEWYGRYYYFDPTELEPLRPRRSASMPEPTPEPTP